MIKEEEKIPKAVVLYIHKEGCKYNCSECAYSKSGATKCAGYGESEDIKPIGTCAEWILKLIDQELPYLNCFTKKETGYVENEDGYSCKRCEYFRASAEQCLKVNKFSVGDTPGRIVAGACCNNWNKQS